MLCMFGSRPSEHTYWLDLLAGHELGALASRAFKCTAVGLLLLVSYVGSPHQASPLQMNIEALGHRLSGAPSPRRRVGGAAFPRAPYYRASSSSLPLRPLFSWRGCAKSKNIKHTKSSSARLHYFF